MGVNVIGDKEQCLLVFTGKLTFEFARELEDRIIGALRRYTQFNVDLSGVTEIDICGIHLLGVLRTMGGDRVKVVGPSPVVDQASRRLLASRRGASLFGSGRREGLTSVV